MMLAAVGIMAASVALGGTNLVQNGSFEQSSYPSGGGSYYWANSPSYVTDWAAAAYGSDGAYAGDYTGYWFAPGPGYQWYIPSSFTNVSSVAGDTLAPGATQKDPDGGYFIYLDGEPGWGTGIQQTITGLTVGKTYDLFFTGRSFSRPLSPRPIQKISNIHWVAT